MTEPAKRVDMRRAMPLTTDWVQRKRAELGKDHVDGCIRRAMEGEPGCFYAIEAGHVVGTPFPASHPVAEWQQFAVVNGTAFAGFIAEPAVQTSASGA